MNKILKRIKREHVIVGSEYGQEVVICEIWRIKEKPTFRLQIGSTFVDFDGEDEWNQFLDMVNNLNNANQTLILRFPD